MIIHKIKKINFVIFYNDLYIPLNSNDIFDDSELLLKNLCFCDILG